MSREQFQQGLKQIAVQHAREILANQEENKKKAAAAADLFKALVDAPTWTVAPTVKPKGFTTPQNELWTQPVKIVRPDDDNA